MNELFKKIKTLFPDAVYVENEKAKKRKNSVFFGKYLVEYSDSSEDKVDLIDTTQFLKELKKMKYERISLKKFFKFLEGYKKEYDASTFTKTNIPLTLVMEDKK